MKTSLIIFLSIFFTANANAGLPKELSGREYSEVMLLLSQSDLDVKVGAKSIYWKNAPGQPFLDLIGDVTWTACSGNKKMDADTMSWLVKILGNTKQARYAGLLDYCLAKVTDSKVTTYLEAARGKIEGTTDESFEGGKTNLKELHSSLIKNVATTQDSESMGKFNKLHADTSLDETFKILGLPNKISSTLVTKDTIRTRHFFVKVRVTEALTILEYGDLGKIRFIYDTNKSDWLIRDAVSNRGLVWDLNGGHFSTLTEYLENSDGVTLRQYAKNLLKQDQVKVNILDRIADRIYLSRFNSNKRTADALAWLCKVIAKSGNAKYKSLLTEVSSTASSPTLKKYAGIAASDLPESSGEDYFPAQQETMKNQI